MQNLIIFLSRHRVELVFILLEILSLILIVRFNKNQQSIFINSSNLFTGWIFEKTQSAEDFLRLKDLADSLAVENARLRTQLDKYQYDYQLTKDSIQDSLYLQEYTYIPAKVIDNSIANWDNTLTLNRGSLHGIKPGMGIISDRGIVGIVQQVSPRFAQAISLLNSRVRISASHKTSGQFGTLYWNGLDPRSISLRDVPKYAPIMEGDTIITNRYSAIFPNGVPVGVIDTFWVESGTNFYYISIDLFESFGKLDRVYVVDYLFKEEQTSLEKTVAE
jgi:rod shape-determining protein MreC